MKIRGFTSLKCLAARVPATMIILLWMLLAAPLAEVSAANPMAINGIAVGAQSGSLSYGTAGSATFQITVTGGGGGVPLSTLSVTGLPADTTSGFSSNTVTCPTNGCSATSQLTVTTTAATRAIAGQIFTIHATGTFDRYAPAHTPRQRSRRTRFGRCPRGSVRRGRPC